MEVRWIKLVVLFFEDEEIRLIDAMPDGDRLIVMWLKFLTLAGRRNDDGFIRKTQRIGFTNAELASILQRPEKLVERALEVFSCNGFVTLMSRNVVKINNWSKHQNVDGLDRIREQNRLRVARFRAGKRGGDVTLQSRNVTHQIEKENKNTNHHSPLPPKGLDPWMALAVRIGDSFPEESQFTPDVIERNLRKKWEGTLAPEELGRIVDRLISEGQTKGVTVFNLLAFASRLEDPNGSTGHHRGTTAPGRQAGGGGGGNGHGADRRRPDSRHRNRQAVEETPVISDEDLFDLLRRAGVGVDGTDE